MATHNWCHNPDCHKIATQSRVRGTGNNKVLRTRKIALNNEWIKKSIFAYFCNNTIPKPNNPHTPNPRKALL